MEIPLPKEEAYNRQSGFDATLPNPGADNIPGALAFLGSCSGCINRTSFQNWYFKEVAPRFGIAYQLTKNVVLRGGYGISYGPPILNNFGSQNFSGFDSTVNVHHVSGAQGKFDPAASSPRSRAPPCRRASRLACQRSPGRCRIVIRLRTTAMGLTSSHKTLWLNPTSRTGARAFNTNSPAMYLSKPTTWGRRGRAFSTATTPQISTRRTPNTWAWETIWMTTWRRTWRTPFWAPYSAAMASRGCPIPTSRTTTIPPMCRRPSRATRSTPA